MLPITVEHFGLTPRLWQVCELAALGLTHQEIAIRLNLTPGSVNQYMVRIYKKLEIDTIGKLIRFWMERVELRGDCNSCLLRQAHLLGSQLIQLK